MKKNNLIEVLKSEEKGFLDYSLVKLSRSITIGDSVEIHKYLLDSFSKLKSFYKYPYVRATNNEYGISVLCSNEEEPLIKSVVSTANGKEVDFKDTYMFDHFLDLLGNQKSDLIILNLMK